MSSPGHNQTYSIQSQWAAHARKLAEWAMTYMVNRTDVWGGYLPIAYRNAKNKSVTKPPVDKRGKVALTIAVLTRHFAASSESHVIGLHTTSKENTSRFGAIEIDAHNDAADPAVNLRAALAWQYQLTDQGINSLLTDSNNKGGYHLLFVLDAPVATSRLYWFLQNLISDHATHGLADAPETFPKQAEIENYGNWLRLPGRHHTRSHWSRVWSCEQQAWLVGNEACDAILYQPLNTPASLPEIPNQSSAPQTRTIGESDKAPMSADKLATRILAYMKKCPNKIGGSGRSDEAFKIAAFIQNDMAQSPDVALQFLKEWDAQNEPTLDSEQRLEEIIANAKKYGRNSEGCGLIRSKNKIHSPTSENVKKSDDATATASAAEVLLPVEHHTPVVDQNAALKFMHTDLGNAQRLVARHGSDIRYCHPWKKWLIWDGTRWKADDTAEIERRAKKSVRSMYVDASREPDKTVRAAIIKWAKTSESATRIAAMISLAQSEPSIPILPTQLDSDPWLLNLSNQTLDLKTGGLHAHCREDYITKISNCIFDESAECPIFLVFIARIFSDAKGTARPDLVRFVQKSFGYSLTGVTLEQCLSLLHGIGANGKTTLLNAMLHVFGDYGKQADPDLLLAKDGSEHPTGQADLFGCRLAVCTETNEGRRFDEARLKRMTGEDRIKARFMRQDFFEFTPTHKIALACNHKPAVRGTDHAFWRRIRLIPFDVCIPPNERDKHLFEKLKSESAGILKWCVDGCFLWQKEGLEPPASVQTATDAYQSECDSFGRFVKECCHLSPTAWANTSELRGHYERFCKEIDLQAINGAAFTGKLKGRGLLPGKMHGNRGWRGIGLLATVDGVDTVDGNSG